MLAHIGALIAALTVAFAWAVPLLILLIKGPTSPFVRRHAVESLNFQITVVIVSIVGTIIGVVLLVATLGFGALVLLPLALVAVVLFVWWTIAAGLAANNGRDYRYPINIRLVS